MKAKEIRNGCLYFNTQSNRVERAIGRVGRRIFTYCHDTDPAVVKVDNLLKASAAEVSKYLDAPKKGSRIKRVLKKITSLNIF
tara:strand:- start:3195 stop:3443 length:249 start_codon:yes stop_codon:yes gene_type:complete